MHVRCSLIKFWWVVLLGCVVTLESNGSMGCLDAERKALMRLKDAFNHPNGSSALPSWQGQGDCCTWERVKCDNSTKRVTQLLLDETRPYELSNMEWSLHASYFLPFEELQWLDLSDNYLAGLFGEIRLSKLQYLELGDNKLTEVPTFDLSSPSKLKELYLGYNSLTGSIPESITNLTSLKHLYLEFNNFNDPLPTEGGLCKLKNLIALGLRENYFVGNIPKCLANLSSLRLLDVSYNDFEGPLPSPTIYSLKSLACILLSGNHFKGSLSFSSLANHSNLQMFALTSYNQQDVKVETENPPFFPSFQLKILVVENCTVNEPTYTIPSFLHHQHDFRGLSFTQCNMVGSFPNWLLANNTKLSDFELGQNLLTGPLELNPTSAFPNMQIFDVSSNPIKGEIPLPIGSVFPNMVTLNMSSSSLQGGLPASLGEMRQLSNLDLSHNNLSGHLPQEFGKGSSDLRILELSNNNLDGPFLPDGSNFTSLISLHLANNKFTGTVQDGVMNNCRELRMLDLSNNQLRGVPSGIGSIRNLTFLILSHNLMQGPIPLGFCKLDQLQYLDLAFNNLSGALPSCVHMPSLRFLHLQDNQFSGPIPAALAKSRFLLTLDLKKNKFSGGIPKWINSLLNLRILLLKGNKLEGPIPTDICYLRNISMLDLSENNLSGGVPSCLSSIAFGRLDFRDGEGIGKVFVPWSIKGNKYEYDPTTNQVIEDEYIFHFNWDEEQEADFVSKSRYESYKGDILNFMSGLDLSDNNLTGHVPPRMGYMSSLHSLNLSNNHLTGTIPETFGNLKQIESLDLSHNTLSGQIPSQLTALYSLSVFSVAHNNLSGRTPERVYQFGTFDASSYEGNSLLCGPPLERTCSPIVKPPSMEETHSHGHQTDFRDTFVWSFTASFVVAFLGVIAFLYLSS